MNLVRNLDFIFMILLILFEFTSMALFIQIIILSINVADEVFANKIFMNLVNCFLSLFQVIDLKFLFSYLLGAFSNFINFNLWNERFIL